MWWEIRKNWVYSEIYCRNLVNYGTQHDFSAKYPSNVCTCFLHVRKLGNGQHLISSSQWFLNILYFLCTFTTYKINCHWTVIFSLKRYSFFNLIVRCISTTAIKSGGTLWKSCFETFLKLTEKETIAMKCFLDFSWQLY